MYKRQLLDGFDELVGKGLGGDIDDFGRGVVLQNAVADGVHHL